MTLDSWGRIDFITYILLKEQTDAIQFNNKLAGYWQTKIKGFSGTLFINPLTRLYLYRDPGFESIKYPVSDKGPITRVILFSVIGFVLLLISLYQLYQPLDCICFSESKRDWRQKG